MHPVFAQAIAYGVVLFIAMAGLSFLFKGFFWKYLRVRASQGDLFLVKAHQIDRHYFRVGRIENEWIKYKSLSGPKSIQITQDNKDAFYRALNITWIDVDDETNAVLTRDLKAVSVYDAEKTDSLLTRCLYKPPLVDKKELIIILLCLAAVLGIVGVFFYLHHIAGLIEGNTAELAKVVASGIKEGIV